ncbi:MAG TPA: hypothetical protein VK045_05165 [Ornithinicoccus sp.]|nr:hypothetical protein [Ornithinicoccus sp.]
MNELQLRQPVLDVVARHEQEARAALEAATGGGPLCRIDGREAPVKEREGAVAALADVRRALLGGADPVEVALEQTRTRWSTSSGPLARRPGSEEYAAGGLAALAALAWELEHVEHPAAVELVDDEGRVPAGTVGAMPVTGATGSVVQQGRWSRRRRLAALGLMAGMVVLVAAMVGWPVADQPLWSALTAGTVVASSLTLALFVPQPGAGWRPDFGCTPCASLALLAAVAGPWLAIATAPEGGWAAQGLVIAAFALARRLTEPPTCSPY